MYRIPPRNVLWILCQKFLKPKRILWKSDQMKKSVKLCENNECVYINLYCRKMFFFEGLRCIFRLTESQEKFRLNFGKKFGQTFVSLDLTRHPCKKQFNRTFFKSSTTLTHLQLSRAKLWIHFFNFGLIKLHENFWTNCQNQDKNFENSIYF